ncbi:MAG: YsnF/AvaK domain-containing protein [Janthinobacterium lividum]
MLSILGDIDSAQEITELRFPSGRILRLPTAVLQDEPQRVEPDTRPAVEADGLIVVPIIEEQLEIGKRTVPTARVRLEKNVDTYDVRLDEALAISTVRVDRVPFGHVVETVPPTRQEGKTTIYPILEERLVLTKELVLVEEVHVTNELAERRDTQVVTLRRERLDVSRDDLIGA